MADPMHSTGRGGAGNIGEDPNTYLDGDIVREGVAGESDRPEYSAGRGGAGNMVLTPRSGTPVTGGSGRPGVRNSVSQEVVPETATRTAEGHENYHTGRGGQGNVHKDKYGGHSGPQGESFFEKAKHAVGLGDKHKAHEEQAVKQDRS